MVNQLIQDQVLVVLELECQLDLVVMENLLVVLDIMLVVVERIREMVV